MITNFSEIECLIHENKDGKATVYTTFFCGIFRDFIQNNYRKYSTLKFIKHPFEVKKLIFWWDKSSEAKKLHVEADFDLIFAIIGDTFDNCPKYKIKAFEASNKIQVIDGQHYIVTIDNQRFIKQKSKEVCVARIYEIIPRNAFCIYKTENEAINMAIDNFHFYLSAFERFIKHNALRITTTLQFIDIKGNKWYGKTSGNYNFATQSNKNDIIRYRKILLRGLRIYNRCFSKFMKVYKNTASLSISELIDWKPFGEYLQILHQYKSSRAMTSDSAYKNREKYFDNYFHKLVNKEL